jgi:outer membrane receptor protein involved in Fe transport
MKIMSSSEKTSTLLLVFAAACSLLPHTAAAQVLYGSIVGAVVDQSDAVVPYAVVTITNTATGLGRETRTDAAGRYSFVNVLPGVYDLKISAEGFRTVSRSDVTVTINTVTRVDMRLEVGAVTEQITVAASAAALQTEKADVRSEITSTEIANLPLANYRNFQSLVNLVPGATPANFQNSIGATPARALTTNINGTARNNNNARVDGATNVYIWLPHHMVYVPPVESIDTVNISTASFDAEQGMAGGAAVTVATKSGTNEFHGVAFHYHDNQRLRTRNFFLPPDRGQPISVFNIFGGTLGGPIKKDKLFFFGSYEGTLERAGVAPAPFNVPTAGIRAGVFTGLPVTLFDPMTGNPDGSARQPFANNVIPASRIHPISQRIQQDAPLPNLPGTAQGTLANFFNSGTEKLNRHQFDAKINWNPRTELVIWGKYSRMDAQADTQFALGAVGGPGLSRHGSPEQSGTDVNIATLGHTWSLSPTLVMDGTFAITKMDINGLWPGYGRNIGSEVWGIPNTNDPITTGPGGERVSRACPAMARGACYSGMPSIAHGFTSWGNTAGWQPHFYRERSFTYTTNTTKIHGAHELRWGFDLVRYHLDHWQPEVSGGPRGAITFVANTTSTVGQTANYLNSYAAFLLGLPGTMSKAVQLFEMTNREWQLGWYVRDRWQVNRRLTLNLGLRYEYFPLLTRRDRGIERWDPSTNQVLLGRIGGNPDNVGITVSKRLFAPRVGFAYRVSENTVLRSGYGITYDPMPFSRPLRGLYPATIGASFVSPNPFSFIHTLDQGIPAIPLPDISGGSLPLPPSVDMGPRSAWGGHLNRGYIQSWNFTVERKLPAELITSIAYVGTQTVHQLADRDINAAPPGGGPGGRPLAATQGRRIAALMWDGWVSGNYHGLQVALNRQFSRGLFLKGAYTWSKAINWTDDTGWAGMPLTNWEPALRRNRAVAGYDRTHMFTLGFLYELPFGPGKSFVQSGPASWLLRGWQTNGVYSAYTGTPFTVGADGGQLNAPGSAQTADQVKPGKVGRPNEIGPGKMWFDPLAFAQPVGVRFGTTGRNTMRGPGMWNLDFSLFRNFRLTERVKMEFKAEAFNFTNTPKFANPGSNVANMSLNPDGSIRSLGNFSSITSTLTALATPSERQLRFGLRLSF